MASIVERRNRYCVVYLYENEQGERKQKWESFKTMAEAKKRKAEVEYQKQLGHMIVPKCTTLSELLKEYVDMHGKTTWSMSMYRSSTALIDHYIAPVIGHMKITDITPRVLEKYYMSLLKMPAVAKVTDKKYAKQEHFVTPATVRKVHNVLRSCFNQAVKWELMEKNPAMYATVPKAEPVKREIWDAETLFHALELCEDERLSLAINLSFACSLRIGELLGLTWDCVDISDESIAEGRAYIYVNKELQRVDKSVMSTLEKKDVLRVFPETKSNNRTVLVLKKPKTQTSTRKVFLPRSVAVMLIDWKARQDADKEALGDSYNDFNLVMASGLGMPTEQTRINEALASLIKEHDLPKVVFHSFRHASITYKLRLNGGDIKAVQGDSGHAQASMVTDQYSHILDDNRRETASLLEEAFYSGKGGTVKTEKPTEPASGQNQPAAAELPTDQMANAELLLKLLQNPETAALLAALAKNLK